MSDTIDRDGKKCLRLWSDLLEEGHIEAAKLMLESYSTTCAIVVEIERLQKVEVGLAQVPAATPPVVKSACPHVVGSGVRISTGEDGTWIELTSSTGKHVMFQPVQELHFKGQIMAEALNEWLADRQREYDNF